MLIQLITYLIKTLVNKPDVVSVTEVHEADKDILNIKVDEHDLGKAIGKAGQTIKAIRAIAYALRSEDKELIVDISK